MEQRPLIRRTTSALTRLVVVLLIFGLGGAVVFLISQLNARTFRVEVIDNNLVITKGRLFPIGGEPYRPADPALKEAYAAIPLEGTGIGTLAELRFNDRDDLDRALFDVLSRLASSRINSDDPQVLDRGVYYLRRAEKLSGLTEEQRLVLRGMQSEVAYYLARNKLDDARRTVAEALSQLKIAAGSGPPPGPAPPGRPLGPGAASQPRARGRIPPPPQTKVKGGHLQHPNER